MIFHLLRKRKKNVGSKGSMFEHISKWRLWLVNEGYAQGVRRWSS
jgi:hypothetical protein